MVKLKERIVHILASILSGFSSLFSRLQSIGYHREREQCINDLLQDVRSIDKDELNHVQENIESYCQERELGKEKTKNWLDHAHRLFLSRNWLKECIAGSTGQINALDLGEEGVASDFWRTEFPSIHWQNTDWDLRYVWDLPADSFDLVTATELIEHISDPPNELHNEGFYRVGVKNVLKESFRVLKPGGALFLTTPNAASLIHLSAVLHEDPPWHFYFHVREYTMDEIRKELKEAGFIIEKTKDIQCLSTDPGVDLHTLFQLLLQYEFSAQGRGDELFVVGRKPKGY